MYQQFEPLDPRDAFEVVASPDHESTHAAASSQAALLLAVRNGVLGVTDLEVEYLERETSGSAFSLPQLRPLARTHRMKVDDATQPLQMSRSELSAESPERVQEQMATTVGRLYDKPDAREAAALFEAGMRSPHPLVRVAAAAGARETTRQRREIQAILHTEIDSDDRSVAELARTALGCINRADPMLQRKVTTPPPSKKRRRESNTAVLTHGTWASDQAWYQPLGDFYTRLDGERPDLDVHDESFEWSGSYTHTGRRQAARELNQWIGDQGLNAPDFFAHSHGATVANLATRDGAKYNKLVYLAWPVHQQWYPKHDAVNEVIDIRVRMDLVIMLDRGGQRIPNDAPFNVTMHRNGWFDHSSVHEPAYWDDHGLWDVV